MGHIDALDRSWKHGAELVAGLQRTQLSAPTPCPDWDVRALLNHTLGETHAMSRVNRGEPANLECGDLVGDDGEAIASIWSRLGSDNVASWRESGLEGDRTYLYGTYPARAGVLINLGEVVVHSWDLAQALGQPFSIDPELAELVLGLYLAAPIESMRAGGILGPEVPVPVEAPVADRMLGLLGRQP